MAVLLSIFLLSCTAQQEKEFRAKYGQEIRQEVKDAVKEAVKEVLPVDEKIEINPQTSQSTDNPDSCTLSGYKCLDFVVYSNKIILQLENNKESDIIVRDFLVGNCSKATSNHKVGGYQMFQFDNCNNGNKDSTFDQDIKLLINEKTETGHIKAKID